jgi:peptide/nickel transport system substrate-binding protein
MKLRYSLAAALVAGLMGVSPVRAQEITVRLPVDLTFIDPAFLTTPIDTTIAANIYSGLLKMNQKTMEPEPDLAKSWEVSPDGLTYTFHLRDNVTWHKGYGKFTAKDVKYSIERILDPKTKSRLREDYSSVKGVEVVDDYTVKILMKNPDMGFVRNALLFRGGYLVNQKAIETLGDNYKNAPVGTGPFVFDHWEPSLKVVLKANKEYFLGAPKLETVNFLVVKEDNVAVLGLEKGELDVAIATNFSALDNVKASPEVKANRLKYAVEPDLVSVFLNMNNCRKPFDDIRVRQAIHHAINKDDMIAVAYEGQAKPSKSVLPEQFFGYNGNVKTYDFNPEMSKKLLAEAGYPNGFDTTFIYYSGLSPWDQIAPIMQEELRNVGIRVKLNVIDRAAIEELRRKGDHELMFATVGRPPDPDGFLTQLFYGPATPFPAFPCYKNAEVDKLIVAARSETDPEKRKQEYEKVQAQIAEDTPVVPIVVRQNVVAWGANVKGYVFNPLVYYNLWGVSVEGKR